MKNIFNAIVFFLSSVLIPMVYGANAEEINDREISDAEIRREFVAKMVDLETVLHFVQFYMRDYDQLRKAGLEFLRVVAKANRQQEGVRDIIVSLNNKIDTELGSSFREDFDLYCRDPKELAKKSLCVVMNKKDKITEIVRSMNLVEPTREEIFERIILLCSAEKITFEQSVPEINAFILTSLHEILISYLAIASFEEGRAVADQFRRILRDSLLNASVSETELFPNFLMEFNSKLEVRKIIDNGGVHFASDISDIIADYIGCLYDPLVTEENPSLNEKQKSNLSLKGRIMRFWHKAKKAQGQK